MLTGNVLSIERCSLHDGPGLRTTVFLKGCPLSCLWCHNPESQSFKPEIYYFDEKCIHCRMCAQVCANHIFNETEHLINRKDCIGCGKCVSACNISALEIKGTVMQAQEVINTALKDERYYRQSGGGLTLSGGEPLAQFDFTLEILRLAKVHNLHTCLETSGFSPQEKLLSLIPYVDLFLYDYKEENDDEHKKFTGVSNDLIIKNLHAIDKAGAKIILRCPIIPGYNEKDSHFTAIAQTANALQNIIEVNIMPYHPMGSSKAVRIGRKYPVTDTGFPKDEQIENWLQAVGSQTEAPVKRG